MSVDYRELLRQLITRHFWGTGLEWSYREGVTLESMDQVLYEAIQEAVETN